MIAHVNRQANGARRNRVVLETRVICGSAGGPDKTILNSPRYLWSAGYETLCAYMHPPGDAGFDGLRRKATEYQAPILSVPDRGPWDWRVIVRLLEICRREAVMIWHGHDYKSNALGLLLRRFWPMRLVTTVHGWVKHTRRTPVYYKIDELCLAKYDAVLCVSDDLHTHCLNHGVDAERCHLIPNAIDTVDFSRQLNLRDAKAKLGIPEDRFVVGGIGRLSAEKGFDILIRSIHGLAQSGVNVELLIAGVGDAEADLRALVSELRLQDRVRFLGAVADPRPVFEAMDVFALSSHREGLPNVVLEAMALETPVIATRVNGVGSLVKDHQNGLLIEPNSVAQMQEALRRLMVDSAMRARFAAAGRDTVVHQYCFAERMKKISRVYDTVLERT